MENKTENQSRATYPIYPSTKDRLKQVKEYENVTWDKIFNMLLDSFENK